MYTAAAGATGDSRPTEMSVLSTLTACVSAILVFLPFSALFLCIIEIFPRVHGLEKVK